MKAVVLDDWNRFFPGPPQTAAATRTSAAAVHWSYATREPVSGASSERRYFPW